MKSSCMACSFPVHPVSVISSPFSNGAMSILCSRLQNCRNRSSHCFRVKTGFPSVAFASRFGTVFRSAILLEVRCNFLLKIG